MPLRDRRYESAGTGPQPNPAGLVWGARGGSLRLTGSWTTGFLAGLGGMTGLLSPSGASVTVDGRELAALDTAGALLLFRLLEGLNGKAGEVRLVGLNARHAALLDLVTERLRSQGEAVSALSAPRRPGGLERLGRAAVDWGRESYSMLSFSGAVVLALLHAFARPAGFRWRQMLAVLERDGVGSMPVLGMLSFLLGVVIAYQSGVQLRLYGGNLYVVDLVGITVLRELGPLMTAIIVAGRSGSAYTAQIGTMQVTQEVDALRSIGVAPLDLLVLPKVLGLVIALPLLTVFADLAAVTGAMVMSAMMLDVSPATFMLRFPEAVSINSLLTGVAKAPVFAAVIAGVGCYQGFQVRGGADSVGRHTTISVVQAIVLVIAMDAAFSVVYSWMGI
ncbi:MAG: ABC transporter permease [Chromatiaceae bacterium]